MKVRNLCLFVVAAAMGVYMSYGCGSSSSTDATEEAAAGGASVESLAAIPTMDLSSYDSSTGSSANLAALLSVSKGVSKGMGVGNRDVGKSSRAGCEANMHKNEVFRMSQQAQLDRCYVEAMETAGLVTIPSGSHAMYNFTPPEMTDEEKDGMCANLPAERTEEREACEQGGGGGGKAMSIRLGRFDNELRIDMCNEGVLGNEATYVASGTQYTADVIRKGSWGGRTEGVKFNVEVDLGATGTVTDGIVTLGSDGLVNAAGQMAGGFGQGTITFEKVGSDSSNKVRGTFVGYFTDPFSGTATSFEGKTYARFTDTGCAKFTFTGEPPAMNVSDMIPFNVSAADQASFLAALGARLGITNLVPAAKLCPNPNFDPELDGETDKSMTLLTVGASSCPVLKNTGVECFGIVNGTTTGNFGESIVTQTFTTIANSASTYYAEVNAIDFEDATLFPTPPTSVDDITFTRNWDCAGPFTAVDFSSVDPAVVGAAMEKCKAIEEKARGNDGMGGYNCGQQENQNGVNAMVDEGGGADTFGPFGGEYVRKPQAEGWGTCPVTAKDRLFVDVLNVGANKYCVSRQTDGTCVEFTVDGLGVVANIALDGGATLTALQYNANPATTVTATYIPANCTVIYNISRPEFAGGSFGGEGGGGAPGDAGFVPQPCIAAGLDAATEFEACKQLCMQPGTDCRP